MVREPAWMVDESKEDFSIPIRKILGVLLWGKAWASKISEGRPILLVNCRFS